jgi:hypothetical protein
LAANSIAPHPFLIVSTRVWILCAPRLHAKESFSQQSQQQGTHFFCLNQDYDAPDDSLNVLCHINAVLVKMKTLQEGAVLREKASASHLIF